MATGHAAFEQQLDASSVLGVVHAPAGGGVEVGGDSDAFLTPLYPTSPWSLTIPSGAAWADYGIISYQNYGSLLPEGESVYLGLAFGGGYVGYGTSNYGWISVERTGVELDAFAWGYETEPGVPIGYPPEPGTLSMLAFGEVVATARRRRGG